MSGIRPVLCAAALAASLGVGSSAAATLKTFHSFCGKNSCTDGFQPIGGVLLDSGAIYGTVSKGGAAQGGSVYSVAPTGALQKMKFKQIYAFCPTSDCSTGANPLAKLIADSAGNLYGTAESGGTHNFGGTVFELVPNAKRTRWTLKVLYAFCPGSGSSCPDGANPVSALTYAGAASGAPYDGTSPLYGATGNGGSEKGGTVFKLAPDGHGGWQESVVYSFCVQASCADGVFPEADLTMDGSGNIYGTTVDGGAHQLGTVYELSGAARGRAVVETVLHSFCAEAMCPDGEQPAGGVTLDGEGNLFGTAELGGNHSAGLAYKLVPAGTASQFQVLYLFCSVGDFCKDGSEPSGDLSIDASGNLYGTTQRGGTHVSDGGTIYELVAGSGGTYAQSTLYSFCRKKKCDDGMQPGGGVALDGAGNLFGTTEAGGKTKNIGGTVYELSP